MFKNSNTTKIMREFEIVKMFTGIIRVGVSYFFILVYLKF